MYQPIDLMAARSMAREREHELQLTLREREAAARRTPVVAEPEPFGRRHRVHDLLVRFHLAHAPIH